MADSKGYISIWLYVILAGIILIVLSPVIFGGWVLVFKMIEIMRYSPGGFPIWAVVMLGLVALVVWRKKATSYAYI